MFEILMNLRTSSAAGPRRSSSICHRCRCQSGALWCRQAPNLHRHNRFGFRPSSALRFATL